MELEHFISKTAQDRISASEFLTNLHTEAHEFSFPALVDYHKILDHIKAKKVLFLKNALLLAPIRKNMHCKVFIYNEEGLKYIPHLPKNIRLYTLCKIDSLKLKSTREEVVTIIDNLFDETFYKTRKKYLKEIVYPLKKLEKITCSVRDIRNTDLLTIKHICKQWADYKLNVEKVFRISFTPQRYNRVFENTFDKNNPFKFERYNKIVCIKGKPYGIFSIGIDRQTNYAYELASITLRHQFEQDNMLFNNINAGLYVMMCKELQKEYNVKYLNRGFTMSSKLKHSKIKFPYKMLKIYYYIT